MEKNNQDDFMTVAIVGATILVILMGILFNIFKKDSKNNLKKKENETQKNSEKKNDPNIKGNKGN